MKRATIFVLLPSIFAQLSCAQQPAAATLKVVDSGDQTPVAAEIHYYPFNGQPSVIGFSDQATGNAELTLTPRKGELLYVKPDESNPHLNKKLRWPAESGVVLVEKPRAPVTKTLLANLNTLRASNDDAKVALVANELSQVSSSKSREGFEPESYRAFARALSIPEDQAVVFDPAQRKVVPSPILQAAIVSFQKENNLKVTKQLDYPTLRAKAGADITTYQNHLLK